MSESPIVREYMDNLESSRTGWTNPFRPKSLGVIVLLASLALLVLYTTSLRTNPYVPAGHEGYVFERPRVFGTGGFRGIVAGPGNYGLSLWRNETINTDIRPKTYTESFRILAKDDLNIAFDFHAVLAVEPGNARQVVEDYGSENWYERFVMAPFRTYIREAVQAFDSRDIKAHREEIAERVAERLTTYLRDSPFVLISLVVGNIDYPDVVARAVERKLATQQVLEEKETQKAIAERDAEIRIEEAKGIAEAQRIINATLTAYYLQHEAINAQVTMADSPNHTTVYIPVGYNGIPLVQWIPANPEDK
jgi:regulator of protease activity HflC (stomatin/prohibitin superfamily)